jgi:DNA-binding MarR family transcriptional regulator
MPKQADIAALADHYGFHLRVVSNAVSQEFARKMAAQGVTVAEWALLRVLYDAPSLAPSALAARMGMTKGAITKLAQRLIDKNLVARSDDPEDRRAQFLALTGPGRALVPKLAKLADANDAAFFGVLAAAERAALGRILKKLTDRHALKGVATD